jgi:phosphate-selective porin OprO and OprP
LQGVSKKEKGQREFHRAVVFVKPGEAETMNPRRIFPPIAYVILAGMLWLLLDQSGAAQERKSETNATVQSIVDIIKRLDAMEARIRSLETRVDALQAKPSESPKQISVTRPVAEISDSEIPLEERFESLDQKLRIIERRRELEKEGAAETVKSAPVVVANKNGFSIGSADKDFQLKFSGYLQADARFFVGHPSPVVETFGIGRARPVFQGTIFKYFDFRIMPDFAGGQTVLQDLHLDFTAFSKAKLRFGKFKSPLGLEVLQGDTDLTFMTRAQPSNLMPGRDVGAQVFSDIAGGSVSYALGILNGMTDGTSGDLDTNDGKDIVGRLFLQPFKNRSYSVLNGLGIGVGASDGNQQGSLPSYKTAGQAVFFSYNAGVSADGNRSRLSPQAYYYAGPTGIMAEYATSAQQIRKGASLGKVQNRAWQVSASYVLGGNPSYRAVTPRRPFNPTEGSLGALEFAVRYGELRVDPEAFSSGFADITKSARQAGALAFGVNWYLARMVKFVLDYEQTRFHGGSVGGNRPRENAILSRFQIGF